MASHRAQLLLTLLPTALAFGMQDVEPEIEPLKVRSETFCITAGQQMHVFPSEPRHGHANRLARYRRSLLRRRR
jgi:hypothetical protein